MHVVEHEQQRLPARRPLQARQHRLEESEACLRRIGRRRCDRNEWQAIRELRHDLRQLARRRAEGRAHGIHIAADHVLAKQLHPGPVRRRTGFLVTATPEHGHAALTGIVRKNLCDAGLAYSRLAGNRDDLPFARDRFLEVCTQQREILLPSHEQMARLDRVAGRLHSRRREDRAACVAVCRACAVPFTALGACYVRRPDEHAWDELRS